MKRWGPVEVGAGKAGNHRRVPWVGFQRVTGSQVAGKGYLVGVWLSWRGRQVAVCRNRWWDAEATWWHQTVCWVRHHRPITVVTKADLLGATPDTASVRILDSHAKCSRCGLILQGAKWVNR